jgi:hypothetical protein
VYFVVLPLFAKLCRSSASDFSGRKLFKAGHFCVMLPNNRQGGNSLFQLSGKTGILADPFFLSRWSEISSQSNEYRLQADLLLSNFENLLSILQDKDRPAPE